MSQPLGAHEKCILFHICFALDPDGLDISPNCYVENQFNLRYEEELTSKVEYSFKVKMGNFAFCYYS